jgi:hypothetical protein
MVGHLLSFSHGQGWRDLALKWEFPVDSARFRITFVMPPGEPHSFHQIVFRALPTKVLANSSKILRVETTGRPHKSEVSLSAGFRRWFRRIPEGIGNSHILVRITVDPAHSVDARCTVLYRVREPEHRARLVR